MLRRPREAKVPPKRDSGRVSQRDGYGKSFVGGFISEDDSVNVGVNVFDSPLNGFSLELEK